MIHSIPIAVTIPLVLLHSVDTKERVALLQKTILLPLYHSGELVAVSAHTSVDSFESSS